MKKIIIPMVLVLVFCIIAGCNVDNVVEVSNSPLISNIPANQEKSNTGIQVTLCALSNQGYLYDEAYKANVINWQEEVNRKYGIDLTLDYISPYYADEVINGSYLKEAIKEDQLQGLIRLNGMQIGNMGQLSYDGSILSLDEYVKDNKGFNALPDYIKAPFMIDGKLYAIPSSNACFPSIRLINKQLLNQTENKVPTTLEQFYEVMVDFRKIEGVVPMVIGDSGNNIAELRDIFYANGCYPSFTGFSSISYDPLTRAHEDYLLKPEAEDLLIYLSHLFENNLLQVKNINDFTAFASSELNGSYYNNMYNYEDTYIDNYELIWYLEGGNTKFLNTIVPSYSGYVLSSETINPQETVDSFINTFINDEAGYYLGYFGKEGINYEVSGGDLVMKEEYRIGITNFNRDYFHEQTGIVDVAGKQYYENSEMLQSAAEMLLKDDILFPVSVFPAMPNLTESGMIGRWFFSNFINRKGNVNYDDLKEVYISYAKQFKGPESLKAVNDFYGTKATYGYDD